MPYAQQGLGQTAGSSMCVWRLNYPRRLYSDCCINNKKRI